MESEQEINGYNAQNILEAESKPFNSLRYFKLEWTPLMLASVL
jgi:hypothetical protein